jgi:short-subunit dehydrogenase
LAVEKMKNKAVIIELDLNDPKEAKFIQQLKLENSDNLTSTLVINAHGQTTGMFEGPVETNQLVLAGYRVVNAGGCGPTCGPH